MPCTKCGNPLVFIRAMSEKWELWKCSEKNCGALHFVESKPLPSELSCTSSKKPKKKSKRQKRREKNGYGRRDNAKMSEVQDPDI